MPVHLLHTSMQFFTVKYQEQVGIKWSTVETRGLMNVLTIKLNSYIATIWDTFTI